MGNKVKVKSNPVCHERSFIEIASTNSYRQSDNTFVGNTITIWCTICGTIKKYQIKEPYSSEWILLHTKTPKEVKNGK